MKIPAITTTTATMTSASSVRPTASPTLAWRLAAGLGFSVVEDVGSLVGLIGISDEGIAVIVVGQIVAQLEEGGAGVMVLLLDDGIGIVDVVILGKGDAEASGTLDGVCTFVVGITGSEVVLASFMLADMLTMALVVETGCAGPEVTFTAGLLVGWLGTLAVGLGIRSHIVEQPSGPTLVYCNCA